MTTQDTPTGPLNRAALIAEIRDLFLDRLTRTMRAAGIDSSTAIEALCASAAQLFDVTTGGGGSGRSGFALANSLTASQIRLVDDNQLELSIRLGDLSKRLRDECANGLYKFHQRFVTLLERPSLRLADDPLSPEAVCRALADMFGSLGDFHQKALAGLPEVETRLVQELPLLYADVNELLVRHQIAPTRMQAAPSEGRAAGRRSDPAGGSMDAMAALQQAVLSRIQPAGMVVTGSGAPGAAIPYSGGEGSAMEFGSPRFEQIMAQIDQWQHVGETDLFGTPATAAPENALHAIKSGEVMSRLRAHDAVALDVLSVLFDALFDDARLSAAVKAAVARLQMPVLKAAILGATFFTDPQHPARVLLETMGQATMGLGADVDGSHPVCAELLRVAIGVQSEFHRDTEVFARYSAELESFMARRNHDLQGSAQGFIALAKRQEEQDLAAEGAWHLVGSRTLAVAPPAIADFLRAHWTKVLVADALAGGERGEAWRADEAVLDDLLWSIQAKVEHDDRMRLAQMVPDLLARIKAGLDRVGVTGEARAAFLDACFAHQAAALRGKTVAAATAVAAGRVLGGDVVSTLELNGLTLQSVRAANPDAVVVGELVSELVIGDWVEFLMPDGTPRCGRLCWISPGLGNPLFLNSAWDCAISLARSILERQSASAQASTGSTLSFFDNAVEKALHRNIDAKA